MELSKCRKYFAILLFFLLCESGNCWDNEELEMFDVVEEVNQNFYSMLGIEQSATSNEIRKAYRKLSLQLHPDKNKEDDAEVKFRQLNAVYEILKDKARREQYDLVLEQGLPDWRQPIFYYRRVRKMGLLELGLLLALIFTVGHYLILWSAYLEKRFVTEEVFKDRKKKKRSKKAKGATQTEDAAEDELAEELDCIQRPRFLDLLPIKLTLGLISVVTSVPGQIEEWKAERARLEEEEREAVRIEEEAERLRQEKESAREEAKKAKVRRRGQLPAKKEECEDVAPVVYNPIVEKYEEDDPVQKKGEWTGVDDVALARAMTRHPGGTARRWEKIAAALQRPLAEVVARAKETKSASFNRTVDVAAQGITGALTDPALQQRSLISAKPTLSNGQSAAAALSSKNNAPQSKTPDSPEEGTWTQAQQKLFEKALNQFPKGTAERWDRIAEQIQGKTKEDCMVRFKQLAALVKARKQQQASNS